MNRYILIPEDTIRVLPPEDGVEAAVEVFCSRKMCIRDRGMNSMSMAKTSRRQAAARFC